MVQEEYLAIQVIGDRRSLTRYAVGRILDVGCGDAYPWSGRLPSDAVCLDLDLWKVGDLVQGDIRFTPFRDKSFDTVTAFEILEHVSPGERRGVLEEMIRVASRRIIVSIPSRNPVNMHGDDPEKYVRGHPKCAGLGPITENKYRHRIDWLFSEGDIYALAKYLERRGFTVRVYRIVNPYYDGYGLVADLEKG